MYYGLTIKVLYGILSRNVVTELEQTMWREPVTYNSGPYPIPILAYCGGSINELPKVPLDGSIYHFHTHPGPSRTIKENNR